MAWVKLEVDRIGCSEPVIVIVVRVAVELNECGSDPECGFVFPEMVNESDGGYALGPEPKLSAGLVFSERDFEGLSGDEVHAFEICGKVFVGWCG